MNIIYIEVCTVCGEEHRLKEDETQYICGQGLVKIQEAIWRKGLTTNTRNLNGDLMEFHPKWDRGKHFPILIKEEFYKLDDSNLEYYL